MPTRSAATWLECVPDRPDSPLSDIRVRQAISLAVDRKALNDAEMAGMSPIGGNWIPEEYAGAIARPAPPFDLAKARQLLTEAGVASGFDVGNITPLPPYFSWAERVASQLRAVNIRTGVQQLERATFYEKLAPGPDRLKGFILQFSGAPGDAAARIRENAVCKGTFSKALSLDCVPTRSILEWRSTTPPPIRPSAGACSRRSRTTCSTTSSWCR